MSTRNKVLLEARELGHEDRLHVVIGLANSLNVASDRSRGSNPVLHSLTADIAKVPADAMLTPINASGHWGVICDETASWKVVNPPGLFAGVPWLRFFWLPGRPKPSAIFSNGPVW